MSSKKTAVIEHLFFDAKAYSQEDGLADPVVTLDEVVAAIEAVNVELAAEGQRLLSTRNPANFWKDLTRSNLRGNFPESVLRAGYAATDAIGDLEGGCFRFFAIPEGVTDPFDPEVAPTDEALANAFVLESLSMPLAMKALGRADENWLAQVAARLRILETHFSAVSEFDAAEMTFLQTGIKMGQSEVDAAYSMVDGGGVMWLLAVEAKGKRDKIHVPQVLRSASGLLAQAHRRGQDIAGVIPMAIKVTGRSQVHVVEFDPDTGEGSEGTIVAESVIELRPHVSGIE